MMYYIYIIIAIMGSNINVGIGSCEYFPFPLNNLNIEFKAAYILSTGFRSVIPKLQLNCVTILWIFCFYE